MGARLGRIQAVLRQGALLHGLVNVQGSVSVSVQGGGVLYGFADAEGVSNALCMVNAGLRIDRALEVAELAMEAIPCERRLELGVLLDLEMRKAFSACVARIEGSDVCIQLRGTRIIAPPQHVVDWVIREQMPVQWGDRGYTYVTSPELKLHRPGAVRTSVCGGPGSRGDDGRGMTYPVIKTGFGQSFWAAIEATLAANEVEVPSR